VLLVLLQLQQHVPILAPEVDLILLQLEVEQLLFHPVLLVQVQVLFVLQLV